MASSSGITAGAAKVRERLLKIFGEMDANNDGTVTFTEMTSYWQARTREMHAVHRAASDTPTDVRHVP